MEKVPSIKTTLLHIVRGGETLLAKQQRVIVGLKSYGGKIEPGQTIEENMCQETFEEGGLIVQPEDIEIVAMIDFYNCNGFVPNNPSVRMWCGVTEVFEGTPISTPEMMDPKWYPIDNLPFSDMILGDELFIPAVLRRKHRYGWIFRDVKKDDNGNLNFLKVTGSCILPKSWERAVKAFY